MKVLVCALLILAVPAAAQFSNYHEIHPPGSDSVSALITADLDGDEDQDVVTNEFWYENLGGGALYSSWPRHPISVAPSGSYLIYADHFDGDSVIDLITSGSSGTYWNKGLGGGSFANTPQFLTSAPAGAVVEITGDNLPDLLTIISSGSSATALVSSYTNLGGGSVGLPQVLNHLKWAQIATGNLDASPLVDLVTCSGSPLAPNQLLVWQSNLGGGSFGMEHVIDSGRIFISVIVADIDGDGDNDVLSASVAPDWVGWYENLGGGSFGLDQTINISGISFLRDVHVADLDGDGAQDLLTVSNNRIQWAKNMGNGQFGPATSIDATNFYEGIVHSSDLDGDGDEDVLSGSATFQEVRWYENLKEGVNGASYCYGDGSGTPCPCTAGSVGAGCATSSGAGGAVLSAMGNAYFSIDSLNLQVTGVPGDKPGLILRGANQLTGGQGNVVGDGLLCVGGQGARSQVQVTSGGSTTFTDFQGQPFGASSYGIGVSTNYQFWYRDTANNCSGAGFNFSNAWTVTWLP